MRIEPNSVDHTFRNSREARKSLELPRLKTEESRFSARPPSADLKKECLRQGSFGRAAPVGTGPCLNATFNCQESEEGELATFTFVLFYIFQELSF